MTALSRARGFARLRAWLWAGLLLSSVLWATGCTPVRQFVENGFKVGPDYVRPPAPLADEWIDASDPQVQTVLADDYDWWTAFNDPVLNELIRVAYAQNVKLQIASARVLQSQAIRAIAVGGLFPQEQTASGSYARVNSSRNVADPPPVGHFDNWATGLNASWEPDFWGKIRRRIETADDLAAASVEDYDHVMVTLIGDVAATYVEYRILQQQIAYTRQNVEYQKESLRIAEAQWKGGKTSQLGVVQAGSLLARNESLVPQLQIPLRQANDRLCTLLGMPPVELATLLGEAPIPTAPPQVLAGVPADLIRRRPDLRAAERQIAAQNAQIGVAEADFYPAFYINGGFGYEASDLDLLFNPRSVTAQLGPGFQWKILNYGRIANNVRLQEFATQELVANYQQKVLVAAQEVDEAITVFLRSREQAEFLAESVKDAHRAVEIALANYQAGSIDYTPVFIAQQFLTAQQNDFARAQGDIAQGLVLAYRALGGGWELRLFDNGAGGGLIPTAIPEEVEPLPMPQPDLSHSDSESSTWPVTQASWITTGEQPDTMAKPRTELPTDGTPNPLLFRLPAP